MRALICILLVLIIAIPATHAQTLVVRRLDSLFDILESRGMAMGTVAISSNGKLVYERKVDRKSPEQRVEKKPAVRTRYRVGSSSKMFTAAIIFQLVEEKKLTLGTKLSTYFPGLPNADKITIGEMLSHRSGLHDYTHDTEFPDWMDKPKTHQDLLDIIASKGPDFEPGTKADYSNSNYLLLGYIIEKITGTTFAEALNKRIVRRIGLKNTGMGLSTYPGPDETNSFKYIDSSWKKVTPTNLSIHGGAGSIVSTPADLNVFIQSLFGGKLISSESLGLMTTMVDGYGMGLFPYDFNAVKGFGHNGRIEEFYSATRFYPEKKLAICYVTNGILFPRTDILDAITSICFDYNAVLPFSGPLPSDLSTFAGTYSSGDLPFKVVCSAANNRLLLEAAGKTMEATPVNSNYFMNLRTGSFFEFLPAAGELQIKETDNVYYLQKEK